MEVDCPSTSLSFDKARLYLHSISTMPCAWGELNFTAPLLYSLRVYFYTLFSTPLFFLRSSYGFIAFDSRYTFLYKLVSLLNPHPFCKLRVLPPFLFKLSRTVLYTRSLSVQNCFKLPPA